MQKKNSFPALTGFTSFRMSPAAWLAFSYLILSVLWILLSDPIAAKLAGSNSDTFEKIEAIKGIFFVLLSGSLLFLLSRKFYNDIKKTSLQRESIEKKFRAVNEAAREGIFDYNIKENKADLNNKMKFFFPSAGNVIGNFWRTYRRRIHPGDIKRLINEYHEIVRNGKPTWLTEFRLLGSDGNYYYVIGNTYIIRNKYSGNPVRLMGALQDVSELRNLQADYYEKELEHKHTLAASIIRAQETERNRWAEELHDNICQLLSVANMYASEICSDTTRVKTIGPELKKLIGESMMEIRQLSANIKTPSFSDETLLQSFENLAANIKRVTPVEIILLAGGFDESKLCPEQKLMIYRVAQEQINNIIKYAEASRIEITLALSDSDEVTIAVKDNGKGFDPAQVKTGIGLRNIQSRLHIYGGHMEIRSAPGKGCSLLASFKLRNK